MFSGVLGKLMLGDSADGALCSILLFFQAASTNHKLCARHCWGHMGCISGGKKDALSCLEVLIVNRNGRHGSINQISKQFTEPSRRLFTEDC